MKVWASRLLLIPLLIFFVLGVREAWDLLPQAGAQQGDSCETIETFTGEGIKETPPFTVKTDTWGLAYSFEANTDTPNVSSLDIFVYSADDNQLVQVVTLENPGSDTSAVNAGAGSYYLNISSANAMWEVTVEDCGEPVNGGPTRPIEEDPVEEDPIEERPKLRKGPPLESGGPLEPPYPTMMDGSCAPEFPVKRGNGCYPE